MPAETSIGMSQETRDRLDDYRAPGHASMEATLEGMMKMLPTAEEVLEDGCSYHACEYAQLSPSRPEDSVGVTQFYHAKLPPDDHEIWDAVYYCTAECLAAAEAELAEMAATEPDAIILGGSDEMRVEVRTDDLHLFHEEVDGRGKEIGIPVPLDLIGEDAHGHDYDYTGEPVYVENAGKIRFSGVVDEIIREETHTALLMERDLAVEMTHHPDEERREKWLEGYCHWYDQECPDCCEGLRVNEEMEGEVECGECGAVFDRASVPEGDIPEAVREYRDED